MLRVLRRGLPPSSSCASAWSVFIVALASFSSSAVTVAALAGTPGFAPSADALALAMAAVALVGCIEDKLAEAPSVVEDVARPLASPAAGSVFSLSDSNSSTGG